MEPSSDLWLYRRDALEEQWNEITRDTIHSSAVLWIFGPPGVGKSCAAYAFACRGIDRTKWDVVWIHRKVSEGGRGFECVKFEGATKWTCKARSLELDDLLKSRSAATSHADEQGQFVFLDGWRRDDAVSDELKDALIWWEREKPVSRRLAVVTSTPSIGTFLKVYKSVRISPPDTVLPSRQNSIRPMQRTLVSQLSSWRLEEYLKAVESNEFFHSIRTAFDVQEDLNVSRRKELVAEKHFVAGGSARAMFVFTDETERATLRDAVKQVKSVEEYANLQVGSTSDDVINCLLAEFDQGGPTRANFQTKIVSKFALQILTHHLGPQGIIDAVKKFRVNPALDGHLFEQWLLASLRFEKLRYRVETEPKKELRLKQCGVDFFDPAWDVIARGETTTFDFLDSEHGTNADYDQCYVPMKWKHAGYNAVCIGWDENKPPHLRYIFMQVTRAVKHSYDAMPFVNVLKMLKDNNVNVGTVELWYVVPLANLLQFKAPVTTTSWAKVVETAFLPTNTTTGRSTRPASSAFPVSSGVKAGVCVVGVSTKISRLEDVWQRLP